MVELDIFANLGAWNNFRSARLDGRSQTVRHVLREYHAEPIFEEGHDGQILFNRVKFASEQDQLLWLLRWS